jgi:hypothetical protein
MQATTNLLHTQTELHMTSTEAGEINPNPNTKLI